MKDKSTLDRLLDRTGESNDMEVAFNQIQNQHPVLSKLPTPAQVDNQYPDKNALGTVIVANIHRREGAKAMLDIVKNALDDTKKPGCSNILQLMHDAVGPTNNIKSCAKLLKSGTLTPEETVKMLDAITQKADELNAALDAYYNKTKNA